MSRRIPYQRAGRSPDRLLLGLVGTAAARVGRIVDDLVQQRGARRMPGGRRWWR